MSSETHRLRTGSPSLFPHSWWRAACLARSSRSRERAAKGAVMTTTKLAGAVESAAIRPFQVNVPEEELMALRQRIVAPRWPKKETVGDFTQGVPLATVRKLARYWATEYYWRKC